MRNTIIICLLGAVVGVGAALYYLSTKSYVPVTGTSVPQEVTAPIPTVDQFIKSNPDTNVLKAGGNSYSDPKGGFGFLYPNDYVLNTSDAKHIRISKKGATQKGQTELYDGVLMVFESVDLKNSSLAAFVDSSIQTSTADGTTEIIQSKRQTSLNGYFGFTYELRGLGSSTYLILQKDSESKTALNITFIAPDPQGKGYQNDVDAILSTVELRK
ncbi:MAG: hypothetical protein ABI758_01950 [Candidatus Woesebacteria bacterium]